MKEILTSRWAHFIVLFSILFVLVYFVPAGAPLRQRIQFLTFDYYLTNFKRVPKQVVKIVDIDDVSLDKLGQWPWPRTYIAEIIEQLTEMGARVIAFDGVLAESDRTSPSLWSEYADSSALKKAVESIQIPLRDNDKLLAEAIHRSGRFVSGFSFGSNIKSPRIVQKIAMTAQMKSEFLKKAKTFKKSATFLPVLESAVAGNGSFMASAEIDGVIRKTSLIFSDGENIYPSLALEALRVSFDQRPIIKLGVNKNFRETRIDTPYRLIIGNYKIPVDRRGKIWLHFRDMRPEQDYISAFKFLDSEYFEDLKDQVKGRLILIGSSAEGLLDLRSTPIGLLPGVEIHANILEQILQDDYLLRPKIVEDAENNYILIVGLLLIMLAPFIGASWLGLICFTLSGSIFYLSYLSFMKYGILLDPVYPIITVLLIYMCSSILSYIRIEGERKQVRDAFGLYISPDFMKELTKNPEKLKLGGDVRELSVMFTDIRNFTSISETMRPEALIQLMNDFLTPMSDLVMENRGTIDKYMGDAMMAFWNAPLDDKDHARHACRTALLMNKALAPINEELKKQAAEEGREPLKLEAGIGINSGPASVGNMGSKQRFAYSALGDTVNLASRLEGQTKQYGVRVLVAEKTRRQVPEFAMLELDLIRVKGKQEPERIFVLLGDENMEQGEYFKNWKTQHDAMLAAYRAMNWDEASRHANMCQSISKAGMTGFYKIFLTRIAAMKANPPPQGWDGIFVATSK